MSLMYDRGAWFLRVIMSISLRALCCLPSVKKQKQFASLTEQDIEKLVEDKDSQNTKKSSKVAKELFADYVKREKSDRIWGIFTRLEINY